MAVVYNTIAIYKRGFKGWLLQFWRRGLFYFVLGFIDVEGNYFVVKAYQYTSLLSAMLLDAWTTPVVMILSFFCLRSRYRWLQYIGVFVALCGLGMLVASDVITGKNYDASNALKGDLFCILGATLYGFSNVGEEFMIRKHPHYEVVGMLSFFATFINFVQLMILERSEFAAFSQQPFSIGMMVIYTVCMFCIYSLGPIMFRMAGAVVFNLSLLTSDFYGLIFGLGLFGYTVGVRLTYVDASLSTLLISLPTSRSLSFILSHMWSSLLALLLITSSQYLSLVLVDSIRREKRKNVVSSLVYVNKILNAKVMTSMVRT